MGNLESVLIGKFTGQLLDRLTLRNITVITPSDTDFLEKEGYVALFDAADDGKVVKIQTVGGGIVSLTLATNEVFPVLVKKVFATGTTAGVVYLCN
jgi:hypothetical protein